MGSVGIGHTSTTQPDVKQRDSLQLRRAPASTLHSVVSFVAHEAQVDVHRHHCFQIAMSLHAGFSCRLGGRTYRDMRGFIINQNVPHSCSAQHTSVLIYLVDAESYLGWQLRAILGGEDVAELEPLLTADRQAHYFNPGNRLLPKERLHALAAEAFDQILSHSKAAHNAALDSRTADAIALIDARLSETLRLKDIADCMGLTPERARHLFAQDTGVPFSQFLLWKRLKRVIEYTVRDGRSLTDAAIESGFTDQSHFCRIFKRMFGISARHLLQNSRFVQFLDPLT